jgi:hypothetical protein
MRVKYPAKSLYNTLFFISVFFALCVTLLTILIDHDRHNLLNNFKKGNHRDRSSVKFKEMEMCPLWSPKTGMNIQVFILCILIASNKF